ncbi:MAG: HPP family protein [Candidatus Magnetominusculus sp. LBB02]|nr:HPP family protein [Candidatus Magnetominusculus sp. LBB02]
MSGLTEYFEKMKGTSKSPPMVGTSEIFWSWIGALCGIGAVAFINYNVFDGIERVMLIGSFGASAVLLYGAPKSPLAQPRNLMGGHVLSALVGVASYQIFHNQIWLASALAVATAIALMHATRTLHPPGGATALIAVISGKNIHDLGFLYALMPVGAGAAVMLIVALIVNNTPKSRRYPEFWF